MSLMYQRYQNPEPGQTLFIKQGRVWSETPPALPAVEKGVRLPTWPQIFGGMTVMGAMSLLFHYRYRLVK